MATIERDEFITHLNLVHDSLQHITLRLDGLETIVAVLRERSEIIQRAAVGQAKITAGRWGLLLAVLATLAEAMHQWLSR